MINRGHFGFGANSMGKEKILPAAAIAVVLLLHILGLFHRWWGLSGMEQIALAILAITAILWISELVPLFVTSFIIILLQTTWLAPEMNAAGIKISGQAFLSPFFSDIILLFLGGFVISAMLHKFDLDQRIAKWILGKSNGDGGLLVLLVILISGFFSMWISNTATAAMMFAVILPILRQAPPGSGFPAAMALSIAFACNLGGLGTPIGTPPNAIAISYLAKNGIHISFVEWIALAAPVMALSLIALWRLTLALYPDVRGQICIVCAEDASLTAAHYMVMGIFLVTCLGWLTTDLHGFSSGTVSLIPIIICFGFRLLDTHDFRTLSWDVLFMLGGGLSLGVGLQDSGLIAKLAGLVPEGTEAWIVIAAFGALSLALSTFISNTATGNLIIPVSVSIGGGSALAAVVVAMSCSGAMALPVSTPPNAIAFGSGFVRSGQMIKAGAIISVLALAAVLAMKGTYWKILGIF